MKSFPMFLRLDRTRRVLIAGGGDEAARKLRLMLRTEAMLTVMAPTLDEEITAQVTAGRVTHVPAVCDPAAMTGVALAFVATGCAGADAALGALARAGGAVVNVVDRPELCDATTPSIVDRDPLVVAIGTEGAAPVLARQVKTAVEAMLEPDLGGLVALVGRLRGAVAQRVAPARRRAFYAWAFNGPARGVFRAEGLPPAAAMLNRAIATGGAPESGEGLVSFIGAGAGGSADLITLRAVQRLQEADIIVHEPGLEDRTLDYARRDADRIVVTGAALPDLLRAVEGLRIVRVMQGDPRTDADIPALVAELGRAGVRHEIVPGVAP